MILEKKYRTGLYSCVDDHLIEARQFIERRKDRDQIAVEVLPLSNYIKSAEEHQQHLEKYPEDMHMCHISKDLLNKYK